MKNNEQNSNNWKVVYVASRAEKKVGKRLTELGVENYIPLKREKKQWSDRKKWVEYPLISGYVFVRPTPTQRDDVFKSSGVLNYVRNNAQDAIVTDKEIGALRMIEEKGYFIEDNFDRVSLGDFTEIVEGPFRGLRGKVLTGSGEDYYLIAIESIEFQLKIRVTSELLRKVKANG